VQRPIHPIQIIGAPPLRGPHKGPHRGPEGADKDPNECPKVPIKKKRKHKKERKKYINKYIKKDIKNRLVAMRLTQSALAVHPFCINKAGFRVESLLFHRLGVKTYELDKKYRPSFYTCLVPLF
jgi:hypothetical protein